jgi:hypothetical protein
MKSSHLEWRELPGMVEARRLLKEARKGPATDADRPRRESRARKQIAGQLSIFGAGNAAEAARTKEEA